MATEKPTKEVVSLVKEEVRQPYVNILEVLPLSPLKTPEQKAGFKAWMNGIAMMTQEQWERKIKEYLDR